MPPVAILAASFCAGSERFPQRFVKDNAIVKSGIQQGRIIVDNIQKSIAAVLGIAALLVLIIPGGDPVVEQPKPAEQAPAPPPPPPPAQPEDDVDPSGEYASQDGEMAEPDEYASFGQPMMDASPVNPGTADQQYAPAPQFQASPQANAPANVGVKQTQAAPPHTGPPAI